MTTQGDLESIVDELGPLLAGRRIGEPGELPSLLDRLKHVLAHVYHTDPVFHARVQIAENLMKALGPDDMREACAYMVGIFPVLDDAFPAHPTPSKTAPSQVIRTNLNYLPPDTDITDAIHDTVRAVLRDRQERLEELCRRSLNDPQGRGILIVRDPATGVETMSLSPEVPHVTIHEYPHGKDD